LDGHYAQANAAADAIERTAAGNSSQAARAELIRGSVWQARGFGRPAVNHFERALDIAERTGNPALVAQIYGALSSAWGDLGRWDRALDFAERQHEANPSKSTGADFEYFLRRGVAFSEFQDREQATASLQKALAIARATGDERAVSTALGE